MNNNKKNFEIQDNALNPGILCKIKYKRNSRQPKNSTRRLRHDLDTILKLKCNKTITFEREIYFFAIARECDRRILIWRHVILSSSDQKADWRPQTTLILLFFDQVFNDDWRKNFFCSLLAFFFLDTLSFSPQLTLMTAKKSET